MQEHTRAIHGEGGGGGNANFRDNKDFFTALLSSSSFRAACSNITHIRKRNGFTGQQPWTLFSFPTRPWVKAKKSTGGRSGRATKIKVFLPPPIPSSPLEKKSRGARNGAAAAPVLRARSSSVRSGGVIFVLSEYGSGTLHDGGAVTVYVPLCSSFFAPPLPFFPGMAKSPSPPRPSDFLRSEATHSATDSMTFPNCLCLNK